MDEYEKAKEMAKKMKSMPKVFRDGIVDTSGRTGLNEDLVYVAGKIKLAEGSVYPAILTVSHRSGEHYGTIICIDGTPIELHADSTIEFFSKRDVQITPYDYDYFPRLPGGDHHLKNQEDIRPLTEEEREKLDEAIEEIESKGKTYEIKEE